MSVCALHHRRAIQGPEAQQQPMGQEESELASDYDAEESLTLTSYQDHQGGLSPLSASGERTQRCFPLKRPEHGATIDLDFIPSGVFDSLRISPRPGEGRSPSPRSLSPFQPLRTPSPQDLNPDRASISSCPEMVGHMVEKRRKVKHFKSWADVLTTNLKQRRFSFCFQGKKDREKTSLKGLLCVRLLYIYGFSLKHRRPTTLLIWSCFCYYCTQFFMSLSSLCKAECSSCGKNDQAYESPSKQFQVVQFPVSCIIIESIHDRSPPNAPEAVCFIN